MTPSQQKGIEQLKQLPWRKDPFLGAPIDQALWRWLNRDKSWLVNGEEVSKSLVELDAAVNA